MSKKQTTKSLVISQVSLSPSQMISIEARTPEIFVRTKPGRGNREVKYVEVGYVITTLNKIFGMPNWDFQILEQGQTERKNGNNTEGEVWVRGKLTILDHKHGYGVSKTQYGQHDIHSKVPIGDAFKAAASDCLKKCASMFGVGLDVMWASLDQQSEDKTPIKGKAVETTDSAEEMFEKAKKLISSCRNISTLIAVDEKIAESKIYSKIQKVELKKLIMSRVATLEMK